MPRSWLIYLLIVSICPTVRAQQYPDSLALSDTVGMAPRLKLFSPDVYTYHAATRLSAQQVLPLLLQSSDSTVQRLASRARRRYWLPAPLLFGSYGLMMGGIRALRMSNDLLAGGLAVGSVATLASSFVIGLSAPPAMHRAVRRYNQTVRAASNSYTNPLIGSRGSALDLTEADTVSIRPSLFGSRYAYRALAVSPDGQLTQAMQAFNDAYINEGIRQGKVIRLVGGIIGAGSAFYLTTYGVTRLTALAAGYRVRGGVEPFLYVSLGGIITAFAINGIANRTTRRVTIRYNELLRTAN